MILLPALIATASPSSAAEHARVQLRDLQASRSDVPLKRIEAQLRTLLVAWADHGEPPDEGAWRLRLRVNTGGQVVEAEAFPGTPPARQLASHARTWRLDAWPVPGDTVLHAVLTFSPGDREPGRRDRATRLPPWRPGA